MHNNQSVNAHLIDEMIKNFVHYGHSKSWWHGGQKVNKKQTKSELFFDIEKCDLINEEQKELLLKVYHNWVSKDGVLHMSSSEERVLHSNQKKVTKHFHQLMEWILEGNEHHLRGWHQKSHRKH
jgi:protein subunit release factor B